MLFKRHRVLSVGVACVSLMALNRAAFAMGVCQDDHKIDPGEYCLTGKYYSMYSGSMREQQECPAGCYCEGWTPSASLHKVPVVFPDGNLFLGEYNEQLIKWCKSGTKCSKSAGYNQCGNSNDAKVWRCPSEFPNSAKGSKKSGDCYAVLGSGEKLYYKQVKCEAGKYLPTGWSHCASCKSDDGRYYCPGGYFIPSPSKSVGLKECPSGKIANSTKTGCIVKPTHCDPGQYLPRGATQCKDCKSRYYLCAGGPITVGLTYDQGIMKCDGNMVANAENTSCVTDTLGKETVEMIESLHAGTISVPAGKYLPAGEKSPATCRGTTNYCPGGEFEVASVDKGIFECPKNTRANKDKTACSKSLTKIQMQYGPSGKNTPYSRQCWLKTNSADDFKACVFGTK